MGLRELKKDRTRKLIADTAWRLFADRGFDQVSVTEVAREAEVAEATVFNYFRTKEDLFYWRLEAFGARLADAIAVRPPGEPALAAFRRYLLTDDGLLGRVETGDREALDRLRTFNRTIAASPALLAREQRTLTRNTADLAAQLAAETGASPDDLRPQIAASALTGVHHALIHYARQRILAGDEPARLAADVRKRTAEAFALLEDGLRHYSTKPADPAGNTGKMSTARRK